MIVFLVARMMIIHVEKDGLNGIDGVIWGDGVLLVGTDHPFGKDELRRSQEGPGIGQVGMRYIWGDSPQMYLTDQSGGTLA